MYHMEKIRRLVKQEWSEDSQDKSGFSSYGWYFNETEEYMEESWTIVNILNSDKFGNPILGIAEKETII